MASTIIRILFFASSLLNPAATAVDPDSPTAEVSSTKTVYRLGKPLVGDDNRIYACAKRNFFAFESNGTIAWSVHLNFTCNAGMAPVHGGRGTIANTAGELYSISVRTPHFRWIQDFSTFDKILIVTSGNNGRLFVTIPVSALVFALDVFTGYVFWQSSVGPLSTSDCDPVVDSNGWISIGSLDGFLYSISPTGEVNKFPRAGNSDFVIQHSPLLDCSGYAVYVAQTEMDGKVTRTIGDYTYISALKPRKAVFTMLAPVTGSIYWSESYPGSYNPFFGIIAVSGRK